MLIGCEQTTKRRTARPLAARAARPIAVVSALALVALAVATLWHQAGTAGAVVTGLLVNAAAAPLAHVRPLRASAARSRPTPPACSDAPESSRLPA
jgi:hypothetical protein